MHKRKIINKKPSEQESFIWNMLGSLIFSASAMLLSLIVIQIVGPKQGGAFAIALTIGQMLLCVGYFEMRTFQVTDVRDEFTFEEYHSTKIIISALSLLLGVGYIFLQGYDLQKSIIVLLVCVVRFFDGYADVYEAQFQKDGRLDLSGKSLAYRTILFVLVLCVVLVVTKKLVLSLIVADVAALFGLFFWDVSIMHNIRALRCSYHFDKIKQIIVMCLPLFIGSFCWTYILSASRIAIDANMASEYQSYYQIIFMPVSVISLFASFVFRPLLPNLSKAYKDERYKDFYNVIMKGVLCMVALTVVCMIGAFAVGIPVLSFVSGCNLDDYRNVLVFLIFAGGFNAVSFVMYYVLTIMRSTKSILVGYVASALVALLISSPMVRKSGITGAAWSYFLVVTLLCMFFMISIKRNVAKDKTAHLQNTI